MRKAFFNKAFMALAAAGSLMLTSCHDSDVFDPNKLVKEYEKGWDNKFGAIDPNQDWSMATAVTATVNVGKEGNFTVKIYSADPSDESSQAYLLAKTSVTGGTPATATFDIMKGLENVYVALIAGENIGITKKVAIENGVVEANFFKGEANKVKTRTAKEFGWEYTGLVDIDKGTVVNTIMDPEKGLQEDVDAKGKFCNYEFESKGEFVIYPVYGCTDGKDQIGYYYYDPKTQTVEDRTEVVLIENLQESDVLKWKWGEDNYEKVTWYAGKTWLGWGSFSEFGSTGFAINIPAGYRVGFWVMNRNVSETKLYSNQILNHNNAYYSVVGTNRYDDLYFGLEDWEQEYDYDDPSIPKHNLDCNDIVFYVRNAGTNDLPKPVPPTTLVPDDPQDTPQSWILACEDMGDTGDYDFNDIVLEVSKINETQVSIKCLAAGGTLPANIYFQNKLVGEAHGLLGGTDTGTMLNTFDTGITNRQEEPVIMNVDKSWTVSNGYENFKIGISYGPDAAECIFVNKSTTSNGKAPQMILVPSDWEWPMEWQKIEKAYPDFGNWNNDSDKTGWVNNKDEQYILKR